MNIISVLLEVIFYLLLFTLISFLLYFFISFRKAENEAERKTIEGKFAIAVAISFFWYGPYIIGLIVILVILSKFFR